MNHPEWRAVALFGIVEGNARDLVSARGLAHTHARRRDSGLAQPRAKAEVVKNASRVRGELDAGTNFFGPRRLFEDNRPEAASCQCQRRSKTANPATADNDRSGGAHGEGRFRP